MYSSGRGHSLSPAPAGKKAASLGDPQTWNIYAYVRNNPTTLTDPSGLLVECSKSLNKKDAVTCQSIINTANEKDKKGNYVNPKLHSIYQRLNDDKRTFTIEKSTLGGNAGGLFTIQQFNSARNDFGSARIQLDFAKIRNTSALPADKVPGFMKYGGIAGDFGLKLAETFGHEGSHGVYSLDHPEESVALQMLINDAGGRHAGDPELLRESIAIDQGLIPTETYPQQNEQTVNKELNASSDE
jgi:hypothetical protein